MRVLHFYKTYLPDAFGGTQQFIYQLASGLSDMGHDVDVLFLSSDLSNKPVEYHNHSAHRARLAFEIASTGFSFSAFRKFSELSRRADIIHYHFPWPFMDLVHFATRSGKPTVVTYHSDIVRQRKLMTLYRPLMNSFLNSVDRIVATSPNYFATSDVLKKFRDKTNVIPIGIDRDSYAQPSDEALRYWRKKVGERFFLFVGMLRYYKGLHILLEALKGTDIPVVIVGSGPIEEELRQHASQLGLTDVQFLGTLPENDKAALLKLCYGVVFPSHLRSEAFGISLLEGAMFGKPMISSEIGTGTTYVNLHEVTGLVVPPSAPEAFKQAMLYLLNNPSEALRMGSNASARYEALFTAQRMVSSYAELYEDLLASYKSK